MKRRNNLKAVALAAALVTAVTLADLDVMNIPPQGVLVVIPCDQLFRDEHQPRKRFRKDKILELAESIKSQGLQQYPLVNFWKEVDGKKLFAIKAGERRWRAHNLLSIKEMPCIVLPEHYSEKKDAERVLAQAAENSSREPHTIADIVYVTRDMVGQEKEKRKGEGLPERGAVDIALRKVEKAFGKKQGWAVSYYQLSHLTDELLLKLDSLDDDKPPELSWGDAISLATAPKEHQVALLREAHKLFPKNPHARRTYIARQARGIREAKGEKVKGRNWDEKKRFLNYTAQLKLLAERLSEGNTDGKTKERMIGLVDQMGVIEIEELLRELKPGLAPFVALYRAAKEVRERKLESQGLRTSGEVAILETAEE